MYGPAVRCKRCLRSGDAVLHQCIRFSDWSSSWLPTIIRIVMQPRRIPLASLAFAGMLVVIGSAAAQTYPSRPITMIVPLAAGGSVDTIARIMAEGMRGRLGQPVIIEN